MPAQARTRPDELAELFEAFGVALYHPIAPELLRATVRRPVDDRTEGTLFDLLGSRAAPMGLRATLLGLSMEELARSKPYELPVVLDRGGRPALVVETRGVHLKVRYAGEESWVSARDLAGFLGAEDERERLMTLSMELNLPLTEGVEHDHHPLDSSRLTSLIKLERDDLFSVLVLAIFIGLMTLVVPVTVQAVVNTVAFGVLVQPLVVLTVLVLAFLAFNGLLRAWQTKIVERLQERLFVRAAIEFAYRVPRIRVDALDGLYAPERVNRFFDVMTAQKAGSALLIDGSLLALQALVGLILLGFYHPFLLAFDFVLILAVAGIVFGLGRGAVPTSVDESSAKYDTVAWLQDVARSPIAFRTNRSAAIDGADDLARRYLVRRRRHFAILFRQIVTSVALQALASASLLAIGGFLVIEEQLSVGQLVAAELVVTSIVAGVAGLGKHLAGYYDLRTALEKIGSVTDLELEPGGSTRSLEATGPASLELAAARFAHRGHSPLYEALSVSVLPGEKVSVVGAHGAGKSTIADLAFAMRSPARGSVLIDGVDVRELGPDEVRRHVALVRDVEIFEGTLFDNVALWRRDTTARDVQGALAAAGLSDTVARLRDGVRTRLLTGGKPLSLGQARRLMLARALVGKPRLLLIDGLLDGFEGEGLDDLGRSLADVCEGRTTLLLLTSRESVAALCDRRIELSGSRSADVASPGGAEVR